jgi:hypothetical protein
LFANWVTLYGTNQLDSQGDGTAAWQLYWHPGANPDPVEYHFFNHLLDGDGQRIGQQDEAVFWPLQWRAGDSIVSVFVLPWAAEAAGSFSMRTGIYRYPSLENVPLLDVAGNPYADAAEFPL